MAGRVLAVALVLLASPDRGRAADDCGLDDGWATPPAAKPGEVLVVDAPAVVRRELAGRQIQGALTGKTVYLSAGHGWTWVASLASWRTQRGTTHGIVEDLVS